MYLKNIYADTASLGQNAVSNLQYQDLMKNHLSSLLQTGLIQGKNPRAIAGELRRYWYGNDPRTGKGAEYCMERLMRTELARVQTAAQQQSFEANDFEEYTFHTNTGCCDICAKLDGKHFKVKDMQPGLNAAPMHPNCRCSVSAYEDSEEYENWIDFLANGGTTEEYNRRKARGKIVHTPKGEEQRYKKFTLDENQKIDVPYKNLSCIATKAVGYDNDFYISDKVKLKPKQLHYANTQINEAIRLVKAKDYMEKPRIIICDASELPMSAVAAYTANDNTLRLNKVLTSKREILALPKDVACSDKEISTYIHEMLHWYDAQEYKHTHGNVDNYLESNRKTGKQFVDNLVKNGYNVLEISEYAGKSFKNGYYDEVMTEYRVMQILKKG